MAQSQATLTELSYYFTQVKVKVKHPITGLDRPRGFQEVEATRFQDNRHMKVVRLSTLRPGRFYPRGNIPGSHFYYRLSRTQGHSAAGRITSTKNSNDIIWNQTRDLPACSSVPQLTAPLRAPTLHRYSRQIPGHCLKLGRDLSIALSFRFIHLSSYTLVHINRDTCRALNKLQKPFPHQTPQP